VLNFGPYKQTGMNSDLHPRGSILRGSFSPGYNAANFRLPHIRPECGAGGVAVGLGEGTKPGAPPLYSVNFADRVLHKLITPEMPHICDRRSRYKTRSLRRLDQQLRARTDGERKGEA
jgi:hypothetical protein